MISKKAVNAFLSTELKDHSFIKEATRKELNQALRTLKKKSGFKFKTKPFLHQLACFYIGVCLDHFLFLLDMGLGKTKVVLDIMYYKKCLGQVNRVLVLVPQEIHIEGWEEQVEEHSFMKCIPMYGTTKERWRMLNEEKKDGIYILNYHGFRYMVSKKAPATKKGKQHKLVINARLIKKLSKEFDAVIFDECHGAKNKQSLTWRACNRLTNLIKIRYALTGTPFGRDPIDLWAQFHMIDKGVALGGTLAVLQQAFFKQEVGFAGFNKWVFDTSKQEEFHDRLQNTSIRYGDTEVSDMPPRVNTLLKFSLPTANFDHYISAINIIKEAQGEKKILSNSFIKLRQVCSGFISYPIDEKTNGTIKFEENPKMVMLEQLIDEVPLDSKLIIFYEFNTSGDAITEMVTKTGIPYAVVRGGRKKGTNSTQIRKFKRDPLCRILIANWNNAAEGGNFQVANYMAFYETPVSPIKRRQCIKRIDRTGQKKRTYFYDIVASHKSSIELKILEYLAEGEDLFASVLDGSFPLDTFFKK